MAQFMWYCSNVYVLAIYDLFLYGNINKKPNNEIHICNGFFGVVCISDSGTLLKIGKMFWYDRKWFLDFNGTQCQVHYTTCSECAHIKCIRCARWWFHDLIEFYLSRICKIPIYNDNHINYKISIPYEFGVYHLLEVAIPHLMCSLMRLLLNKTIEFIKSANRLIIIISMVYTVKKPIAPCSWNRDMHFQ